MAFDSEKWALSFYGVIDERFAVETDLFNLHIYRKQGIMKLQAERSVGKLDIFIPNDWDMEEYGNQKKMRKLMLTEIEWQALNIYQQRTNQIASRIGLSDVKVSVVNRGKAYGWCNYNENHIVFQMWTICSYQSRHVDHLISHELAHFYVHSHSEKFWHKLDEIYSILYHFNGCKDDVMLKMSIERHLYNRLYHLLRCWSKPSGLKEMYNSNHIKDKEPFIEATYIKNKEGKVVIRRYWYKSLLNAHISQFR